MHRKRARSILDRWARRNGYRIIDREVRLLRRGPFFLTTGQNQEVYRVTVEDGNRRVRRGYVRCGGFLFGLLSDRADVRWDPEPPQRPGFPVVFPSESDDPRE
ncbi:MAG TPA: hypothetical protein VFA78_04345 [Chloroflexota bacterium]|nr:hypothetical protein [Chloroflexota bacterium]